VRVDYVPTGQTTFQSSFFITLQGSGSAASNSLAISPPSGSTLAFGSIQLNQISSPQRVQITNNGTSTLVANGSIGGDFTISGVGSAASFPSVVLAPLESALYDVRCEPTTLGPQSSQLMFSSMAPTVGVKLSCNGIAGTGLAVTPTPANFPSTLTGKPVDVDVKIENTGGADVQLIIGLSGQSNEVTLTTDLNGTTLGSGSAATTRLHYAAATDHPMSQLGTLDVGFQGGTNLPVAINGEALPGTLGVSPGMAIDFGPVCVGATATQPVSLYASAAGTIDVSGVSGPQPPFAATSASGSLAGNHGNSLDLSASVMPTTPGELTDKLLVHTDLPVANQEVTLMAKALPAGVTPTPDVIHFGPNRVSMATTTKEVTVTNCGTAPLTFTAARIEGADQADFALVSELPATPVGQRASTKFLVIMTPHSNGAKQAQLVLEHADGTISVALDGNGFGGDDVSNGGDKTYYSCNAGGASAAGAAFGLGLIALLRRRRRRT
jgi:uncharacterized protein (TIGR03382 family)